MINREDIKSIKFITRDKMEKSISDDLYNSGLNIDKTGVEIKEQLKNIILENIIKKNAMFTQMDSLVQQIGESPVQKLEVYELREMREKLQTIPYKYSYKQIYGSEEKVNLPNGEVLVDGSDTTNPKQRYNSLVWEYIDLSVDCIVLKTIIDNLKENKTYQLNPTLAAKFGF